MPVSPHGLLRALADLVLAPVCLGCRANIAPGDHARLVCRRCRALLQPPPAPTCQRCGAPRLSTGRTASHTCPECEDWPGGLVYARAACLLKPPADTVVHQLKYRGWKALAAPMAERMAAVRLPDASGEAALCVPVPTTRTRLRQRGYNQAELLAEGLARLSGREMRVLLERTRAASSQTTLQPLARGANVAGAFRATAGQSRSLRGAHLLLVDDVLTTGATAMECARTLIAAGARCVTLITFARALDVRRLTQT